MPELTNEQKRVKYMHTINNRPAFYDGEQICYAATRRPIVLAESRTQIMREQRATIKWRISQGFQVALHQYGYFRIAL